MTETRQDVLERTVAAVAEHGSQRAAAKALGIGATTVRAQLREYEDMKRDAKPGLTLPDFGDDDIPTEEIVQHMERRFQKRWQHRDAKQWFQVRVNDDGPIGVLWFGDPHVDDDGCNWPLLRQHIEIAKQPGIYGANIGDTTNNWSGRLARLFAEQETSQHTARKLARWFLTESGVRWLLWIMGNHDAWGDGSEILRLMGATMVKSEKPPMEDWQARFRLVFPNGREARVHAAHNFSGHSIWNSLHGPQRAAHTKAEAHLYVAGHTHNWALHHEESASREFTYWLARCRGYKFIDHYGENLGHMPQQGGAAILSVFDPEAKSEAAFVQCFADPEEGAAYLQWKRSRQSCGTPARSRSQRAGGKSRTARRATTTAGRS